MKNALLLFLSLAAVHFLSAQAPKANPNAEITLAFQQSGGTNGSAVAWNPVQRIYYSVIAGNREFPLEVFDEQGRTIIQSEAGADMRGLWWNPKSKSLQGNCAGEEGWVETSCDLTGMPLGAPKVLIAGAFQPDFQSAGTYDVKKKKVVFYDKGALHIYNAKNGKQGKSIALDLPVSAESVNFTSVGYTGQANYEFVLLDFERKNLYFFNRKGKATGQSQLPKAAAAEPAFRFSFANGMAFLYDAELRTWTGYRVF
jgi:hypothetical protein